MLKRTSLPITPLSYGTSRTSIQRLSRKLVAHNRLKSSSTVFSTASSYGTHTPSLGRLGRAWM